MSSRKILFYISISIILLASYIFFQTKTVQKKSYNPQIQTIQINKKEDTNTSEWQTIRYKKMDGTTTTIRIPKNAPTPQPGLL